MQKTGKTMQIHSFNEIQNISGHLTDSIRKKRGNTNHNSAETRNKYIT